MQAYVEGAPRKKQLLASVVEHLNESHKNIMSITFQSHVIKFDQKRYSRHFFVIRGYAQCALRKKSVQLDGLT